MPKDFQTRSPKRDGATDIERRNAIAGSIATQRKLASDELEGLRGRMEADLSRAAFGVEAEGSWDERDPADEAMIRGSEAAATAARRRIDELCAEIALMDELMARLDALPSPIG